MTILAFLLLFGIVIFVHELGHFAVGKLSGADVDEFGFGYPPKLFSLGTWHGTEYTINAIPLGGFVKMGEEDDTNPNSMANKPWYIRALAYLAGPFMNLVLAIVCYTVLLLVGQPTAVGPVVIEEVAANSPAEMAGLLPGDQILTINGKMVQSTIDISQEVQLAAGLEIDMMVERAGDQIMFTLVPRIDPPEGEGAMGVLVSMPRVEMVAQRYPLGQAIMGGLRRTGDTIRLIFAGFAGMIRGAIAPDVTGPVGLVQVTGEVARAGWINLIELGAMVSVNLFILNLLPIPPLDGFRLLVIGVELVRRGKRVPPQKEGIVNAIGMLILLALMVIVTYRDIIRWISGESILR